MGCNLLSSFYFEPANLSVSNQFYLSKWVALVLVENLHKKGVEAVIKWPNDIYVKDKKIAGVLIENQLSANKIKSSIIGIGLNVNQTYFDGLNATSLRNELGVFSNIDEVLFTLISSFNFRLDLINENAFTKLDELYHQFLLGKDQERKFSIDGNFCSATIKKVNKEGLLEIQVDNQMKAFDLKEIKFEFN